mgnify:CR=1 FL=1
MQDPQIEINPHSVDASFHIAIGKETEAVYKAHKNQKIKKDVYSTAERSPCYEGTLSCLGLSVGMCCSWVCCCCAANYRRIPESHFGVVTEFGKFKKTLKPGLQFINSCTEQITLVDKRETVIDLNKQSVMSKDNVSVMIDAVVYYTVLDPYRALFSVTNLTLAVSEMAQTALKEVFGLIKIQSALEHKEEIAKEVKQIIDPPTADWGIKVNRVLIKDIFFSKELADNLASAALQKRLAESKVIGAQADVDSARLFKDAAELLSTDAAMQIRYLGCLEELSKSRNTKILFANNAEDPKKMLGIADENQRLLS